MADSERPRDRDDGVPDAQPDGQETTGEARTGGEVHRCECHKEPDRGVPPSRMRGRMISEALLWIVRIYLDANGGSG